MTWQNVEIGFAHPEKTEMTPLTKLVLSLFVTIITLQFFYTLLNNYIIHY